MRKTKALYGNEAKDALISGVEQVYNAVRVTMGAKGRNVVYKKYGMPIVTNDGVSIAREIIPEDPYEYLGAESIKQASEQTNFEAGDGTTSTIVFGRNVLVIGEEIIRGKYNPMVLRREIEIGTEKILEKLKEISVDVKDLEQVAKVAVENDEIAKLVSKVVTDVGVDGAIDTSEAPGVGVRVDMVKGYTWKAGYSTPYMITNEKGEAVLENCAILVTDRDMSLNSDLIKCITSVRNAGYSSLLIIANSVEGELLQTLLVNKQKGIFTTVVVKRPETVQELEDLAILTNGVAVTKEKDIKEIGVEQIGMAEKVVVNHERTILVARPEQKEAIDSRIKEVKEAIKATDQEKYGSVEVLKKRLSKLTGGVAQIKVGASTEAEQAYLKMKVDDAVGACRAALEEGIVPGGGTTLRDLAKVLDMSIAGEVVLATALTQPYLQILHNAGIVLQDGEIAGNYNVLTGEKVEDMMEAGIVDPTKVIRQVITNGVSFAKTLLTTEVAICDIPKEDVAKVQVVQ